MPGASRIEKKEAYHAKLCKLLDTYDRAFIVHADNVGSKQFQDIRKGLRPNSVILMGKNTMMKRSIRLYCEQTGNDKWAAILDYLVGNVGVVFTSGDLSELRNDISKFVVGAPARVGLVAPKDVTVPAGPTGMDPSQTSFFQALNIATKINKGTIEITSDVHLIKVGEKVGASEATLLSKLNIKPFSYGLVIQHVYEAGALYSPAVLDITDDAMMSAVLSGISNVAALSLATRIPTLAALPHIIVNGYKNVLALALETGVMFPLAEKVKNFLDNPDAFVVAAPVAASAPAAAAGGAKTAAKKPEPEPESEEEDMGFSLFD